MKSKILILLFFVLPLLANPAHVVTGATVVGVENTSFGTDEFVVFTSGGTGVCANRHVRFYRAEANASAGNAEAGGDIYKRAYSSALTAFAAGFKVNIATISDNSSCDKVVWIKIYK